MELHVFWPLMTQPPVGPARDRAHRAQHIGPAAGLGEPDGPFLPARRDRGQVLLLLLRRP
jgi:hypothetical protein